MRPAVQAMCLYGALVIVFLGGLAVGDLKAPKVVVKEVPITVYKEVEILDPIVYTDTKVVYQDRYIRVPVPVPGPVRLEVRHVPPHCPSLAEALNRAEVRELKR